MSHDLTAGQFFIMRLTSWSSILVTREYWTTTMQISSPRLAFRKHVVRFVSSTFNMSPKVRSLYEMYCRETFSRDRVEQHLVHQRSIRRPCPNSSLPKPSKGTYIYNCLASPNQGTVSEYSCHASFSISRIYLSLVQLKTQFTRPTRCDGQICIDPRVLVNLAI
jgi:hypothetical protein